jgi:hypothetical protein
MWITGPLLLYGKLQNTVVMGTIIPLLATVYIVAVSFIGGVPGENH